MKPPPSLGGAGATPPEAAVSVTEPLLFEYPFALSLAKTTRSPAAANVSVHPAPIGKVESGSPSILAHEPEPRIPRGDGFDLQRIGEKVSVAVGTATDDQPFVQRPDAENDQVSPAETVITGTRGKFDGTLTSIFVSSRCPAVRNDSARAQPAPTEPYPASRQAATKAFAARATSVGVAPGR